MSQPQSPIIEREKEREVKVSFTVKMYGRPRQIEGAMLSLQNILSVQGWVPEDFQHEVVE